MKSYSSRDHLRVPALHFHEFLGVESAHHDDATNAEAFGSHVGDLICDVEVHALDYGHHRDERGGREDDAEQRQEAAELTGPQGAERDGRRLRRMMRETSFSRGNEMVALCSGSRRASGARPGRPRTGALFAKRTQDAAMLDRDELDVRILTDCRMIEDLKRD